MRRHLLLIALLLVTGCGAAPRSSAPTADEPAVSFPLPFGLRQVEGTTALGRPASYDEVLYELAGRPVEGSVLKAAYRVTADDPALVFQQWVDQLGLLPVDRVGVSGGAPGSAQWLTATAFSDGPGGFGELQLWTTDAGPVLLVEAGVAADAQDPTVAATTEGRADAPRPGTELDEEAPQAGDVLFSEQGVDVRVPDGARALTPTVPTPRGTGGSTSVLVAEDGAAAVADLLAQAQAASDSEEVTGPVTTVVVGVRVVRASFVIPAGGWGFSVVAVQGEDDPTATVHVTSSAD